MAVIYYEIKGFNTPLPNGLVSPKGDDHRVPIGRLVWAAATIGAAHFGPRLRQRPAALELQWRAAMMRASIEPGSTYFRRSNSYERLDPSEKGAVSFFLGQAQAKLFAHDFFRVSRFVHYDYYLECNGRRRARTRPDFLGYRGKRAAIAVEAKGRSLGWDDRLIAKAKTQAQNIPHIDGYPVTTTYAHVAYFDDDCWFAYLVDPPQWQSAEFVKPAALTLSYYLPIVAAIRERQTSPERGRFWDDDVTYLRAFFEDVDIHLSVREDIAERVPPGGRVLADPAGLGSPPSTDLYELALSLDAESDEPPKQVDLPHRRLDDELSFLGGDGVGIELGRSWTDWRTSGDQ